MKFPCGTPSLSSPPRSGEIVLSDHEGSRVRIFRHDDRYVLTADRRNGASLVALQAILTEEQYARLARFSAGPVSPSSSVEVERKWRLTDGSPRDLFEQLRSRGIASSSVAIEQGYLVLGASEARLRRMGADCFLTLKGEGGRTRCETEVGITREQFEALWLGTEGRRLEKTRTSFTLQQPNGESLVIEVDQFHGRHAPLAVVECEFSSESAAERFDAPSWFGLEVTEDRAYKNKALVRDGVPQVSLTELRAPRAR
jgi:adenylate cyclase